MEWTVNKWKYIVIDHVGKEKHKFTLCIENQGQVKRNSFPQGSEKTLQGIMIDDERDQREEETYNSSECFLGFLLCNLRHLGTSSDKFGGDAKKVSFDPCVLTESEPEVISTLSEPGPSTKFQPGQTDISPRRGQVER